MLRIPTKSLKEKIWQFNITKMIRKCKVIVKKYKKCNIPKNKEKYWNKLLLKAN